MALKNETDLSGFGLRLMNLMKEAGYDTPKKLATELYNKKLASVTPRKGGDIFRREGNAIESISKKINNHIKSTCATCLQGEFVKAYCEIFNVSADYLFGYTEIRSQDIAVREICKKTSLSENSVIRLINANKSKVGMDRVEIWSKILDSDLFFQIPDLWNRTLSKKSIAINNIRKAEIDRQKMGIMSLDEIEEFQSYYKSVIDIENAGLLFNMTRYFKDFIQEQDRPKKEAIMATDTDQDK